MSFKLPVNSSYHREGRLHTTVQGLDESHVEYVNTIFLGDVVPVFRVEFT
jgi:hypothetical protein